ncbi:MAG: DTW domain-containing protein, partial [Opitutaceae bacterium]|nr:DTW domain-containing protein [Opitutaceae bacterium]
MSREMCYRCFWPKALCWCPSIQPMATRARFVLLMHPKEFKREKAGTGRLTHLCLADSEIHMGIGFDGHAAVQALINDPRNFPVLLYPGESAINLSGPAPALTPGALAGRRLVVFLLDATWSCARAMLRLSPSLQRLRRVMFTPSAPSRFVIKQQPQAGCLSTLEAAHELLLALERAGLDAYPQPGQLPGLFQRMQDHQIRCASDPALGG